MELKVRDLSFRIVKATISAGLSDPYWHATYNSGQRFGLNWGLNIETEEKRIDDEIWRPRVYHEALEFPIRHWMELAGQVVKWDVAFDPETNKANGGFYVWEHGEINRALLQFSSRQGLNFPVRWSGDCNIYWDDEEYGEDVPFSLETTATFERVRLAGSEADTDETMVQRLSQYLDPDNFTQQPIEMSGHKYEDGVAMAECIFVPKV